MPIPRFRTGQTALLVIDMQQALLPAIAHGQSLVAQAVKLLEGARLLKVPVLITEQYPRGLKATIPAIADRLTDSDYREEKMQFSAASAALKARLADMNVRQVLVVGVEAHVCVMQSCLDLAESGYIVALVTDAIGSRRLEDQQVAVQRMIQAGIVVTTVESVLLELLASADAAEFKAMLKLIK